MRLRVIVASVVALATVLVAPVASVALLLYQSLRAKNLRTRILGSASQKALHSAGLAG